MKKAQQKIEYRWDDFLAEKKDGKIQEDEEYEPVLNFDPRFHYYDKYVDTADELPETSTREAEEAKSSVWEIEGLELDLSMALDPESFAAKVLSPKKRKPDPEPTGEGPPQNPTAKRKPDGTSETSRGFPSASPSASQDQTPMDLETQSGSIGRSTRGALGDVPLATEVPQVRPTHTPVSAGEITDAEHHRERSTDTVAERHQYVEPPERASLAEEQAMTGHPVIDLEHLIYQDSKNSQNW